MQEDNLQMQDNVASVNRGPRSILPDGPARDALVRLAQQGDVYCYCSGGETYGTWVALFGDLADPRADHDRPVPLTERVASWRALLGTLPAATFSRQAPGDRSRLTPS